MVHWPVASLNTGCTSQASDLPRPPEVPQGTVGVTPSPPIVKEGNGENIDKWKVRILEWKNKVEGNFHESLELMCS